jgi:F420-dependent oxidoreductase-like protein
MRFSIWPFASQPWPEVLGMAQHAEATGWDGVYVADHFMANRGGGSPEEAPTLEAGAMLAALAAAVPRVRLGSLVFGNTYRHPAVLANMAATIDHVCEGRFTLGVGAGWQVNEHEQYGIELPPTGPLIDRFAEALQVLTGLLRQERTTFAGEHYRLTDALCEPKPLQGRLPILVGAAGEKRMLGLVAQYADVWNAWGLPDLIAHKSSVLDAHCERVGRDPADIGRSCQALVFVTEDDAAADALVARAPAPSGAAFGGTVARITDVVGAYAQAGVEELIVPGRALGEGQQALDRMDALIEQVAPAFR